MQPKEYPELPCWMASGADTEPVIVVHYDTMVRLFGDGWHVVDAPKPAKAAKADHEATADADVKPDAKAEATPEDAHAKPAHPTKADAKAADAETEPTKAAKTESAVKDDGPVIDGSTDSPDSPAHRRSSGR